MGRLVDAAPASKQTDVRSSSIKATKHIYLHACMLASDRAHAEYVSECVSPIVSAMGTESDGMNASDPMKGGVVSGVRTQKSNHPFRRSLKGKKRTRRKGGLPTACACKEASKTEVK